MATVGPWVTCLGPREAMIFGAACPITLNRLQGGPIMLRSAKILNNLTLEQNGRSQGALLGLGSFAWVLEKPQFLGQPFP